MPSIIRKLVPVATILAGVALLAGIVTLYTRTERHVIARHEERQLLMVQAVASALGKELDRRIDAFQVVASQIPPTVESVTPDLLQPLQAAGFRQIAVHASGLPEPGKVVTGRVVLGESGMLLPVSVTLENKRALEAVLPFETFGPLVEMWNRRVGGRLWLLDDEGRLIYSQLHPAMLGRSALGGDTSCLSCHSSFAMENAMVAGQSAAVEHQVSSNPNMLVYYGPVEFTGRRWSLAMSDPQSEVIAVTRRGFVQASTLTALFLILMTASGVGMFRLYQQKIDAERRVEIAENRARLEARMARAEQLAAIGKMTAQIAHEINTPLASISLNVAYVTSEVERRAGEFSPDATQAAGEIQREVERLKTFTGECLKLTRIHAPRFGRVSLTDVVRGFLTFISREARRHNVQLHAAFESEAIPVLGDGDLLRQILLNLTRNAFDAMPGGGRLEITLFRAANMAELVIADSGAGVPADQREKIFDAFFTTKAEGTGLGLAVVRRIIEQHGGQIVCGSAEGGGAKFIIRIPLQEEVLTTENAETAEEVSHA